MFQTNVGIAHDKLIQNIMLMSNVICFKVKPNRC